MTNTDRRDFLKQSAIGLAATGITGTSITTTVPASDVDERRRLVAEARFGRKKAAVSKMGMVVCAHPLATRAGVEVLRKGGNACDAALATSITQTVVEPHMTTITGVLSLLYYDAKSGKTSYMNGGMNAPKTPLVGFNAGDLATGRGVGVPGWWAGFEAALAKFGTRPKSGVMATAIRYARDGFEIHPFLFGEMFEMVAKIGLTPEGREMYMPKGALLSPGDLLIQKRAADTLERLAAEGGDYFYRGEFAKHFCEVVQKAKGVITREDLESYKVRWQEPARGTYRGYEVLGSPPPDNGGTHIIEALNMIELMDLQKLGPPAKSAETLYQMIRIHNEVYNEGGKQNDPESHYLPLDLILSKEFAQMRFKLLQMASPLTAAPPPHPGSTHVTVVDGAGNVATILHSCMSLPWSNGLFVDGINICASGGHFFRVMPKPGYRASAYVAPNIIFKNGRPILASGSPSVGLLANILQNIVNILDFGLPLEESVHIPRFGGRSLTDARANMIEVDLDERIRTEVAARGVPLEVVNPWNFHCGSFEGIHIDQSTGNLTACGDPRRAGQAEGV
jgi:gamma-glutamyltranspeptidase/glutathione hydrolase